MGFKIKLIIGSASTPTPETAQSKKGKIDGDYVWHPYLKDKKGQYIETGRTQHVFLDIAVLDLCKPGPGAVCDLYEKYKNKDEKNIYKWFRDGNTLEEEDCYGNKKLPVPVSEVIEALKENNKDEEYCRFSWPIALLKAIEKSRPNTYSVIMFGH